MKTFKDTKYGNLTGQVYEDIINVSYMKLDSLEGAPKESKRLFICSYNNLKSLEGGPKTVNSNYYCGNNKKLESLKGAPEIVTGNFDCTKCPKLTSLDELLDTEIGGELESNIMTNEEFRELQKLYNKAGKNMKKYELLKKLKGFE